MRTKKHTFYVTPDALTRNIGDTPMRVDVGVDTLAGRVLLTHVFDGLTQVCAALSPADATLLAKALLAKVEFVMGLKS